MKVKDWRKFQHYKDRKPEWIKLYRELLDDLEWFKLDGEDSKVLVMLWLLASEDETLNGTLPDVQTMCFRLRIEEKQLNQHLINLSEWLEQDASTPLADCYQPASLEREREKETQDKIEEEEEVEKATTKSLCMVSPEGKNWKKLGLSTANGGR